MEFSANCKAYLRYFIEALLCFSFFAPVGSDAAGVIKLQKKTIHKSPNPHLDPCFDVSAKDECQRHFTRLATGMRAFSVELSLNHENGAPLRGGLTLIGLQSAFPIGTIRGALASAQQIENGLRLEGTLLDFQNLYFCQRPDGKKAWPLAGPLVDRCLPQSAWGLEGSVAQILWDEKTHRFVGEWMSLGMSHNLYGNGQGLDSLYRNFSPFLKLGLRHYSYGRNSQAINDSDLISTGTEGGIRLKYRSRTGRWLLESEAKYRLSFDSTSRATQFYSLAKWGYYIALGPQTLARLGLFLNYSKVSQPWNSFSRLASDSQVRSSHLGIFLSVEPFQAL